LQQTVIHIKERILLEQLLAGESAAREMFYDKYAAALYGMILQIVPISEIANRVLVKAFAYAYQHIPEYMAQEHTNMFTWLMRKTREIAIREIPPIGQGSHGLLLGANNNQLQRFTETLSNERQQVFRLCYFKGVTPKMVGTILGMEEEVLLSLKATMIELRKFLKDTWS
jgi:DNA-directed RNA polymerase specialized sigma24 family protein